MNSRRTGERRHIALFLSSLAGGGAERVILQLAEAFGRRGHRVDLVLSSLRGELVPEIPETSKVVELGAARATEAFRTLFGLPFTTTSKILPTMIKRKRKKIRSLPNLVNYLREERPEVLMASTDVPNLLALWGNRIAEATTRVFIKADVSLETWVRESTDTLTRKLPRLISDWYPRANGLIAVSAGLADELSGMTGVARESIRVIYNPIDCQRIAQLAKAPLEDPWFDPGGPPVVLAVGRLHPQKDYPTLFRAFAEVRKDRSAGLAILGDGPERVRLESLTRELGIEDDVRLLGFQQNPFAYMARASVFVLSSAWEGLSNVLIEALACGCPVVSTDCPHGPKEVLKDGRYGKLVPVKDPRALADALASTLDGRIHPDSARKRASQFDIETVTDCYSEFFFGVS
jgi:glycosyltransferase involved in cell wall biosynthesis